MAGSPMRAMKSCTLIVSSADVKFVSTCFCVATVSVAEISDVSCADSAVPVLTVYWFGRRTFSVVPIFAPSFANCSSYWRLMVRDRRRLLCRMTKAPRVT